MDYINLGNTELRVSRLCFGALTIGPLQANLTIEEGAEVVAAAIESGINFIDTAEIYRTYQHIGRAVRMTGKVPVIASKTYAYNRRMAERSLNMARKETGLDVIDIFLLHEQESIHTLRGHMEALEFFCEAKQKGMIKAVGISTHRIEAVKAAAEMEIIDVIHPIVNIKGVGIEDGSKDEMLEAIRQAYVKGKGIYSMKPLGGGNLINSYEECMNFVLNIRDIHSVAIGMQSVEEVYANIEFYDKRMLTKEVKEHLKEKKRRLHIEFWCEGCGKCVERCSAQALSINKGKAVVNMDKCITCGYCGSSCPSFAIKII